MRISDWSSDVCSSDLYDRGLISAGGGVFSRSQKSIPLSPEVKLLLDIPDDALEPTQLISAILKAPADLLWFGGIGTLVTAAAENTADVGATANERLRGHGAPLRANVVGEGDPAGVTPA